MPAKTGVYPGRPREFDELETLSQIMKLFWKKGYEGTGLSEVLKITGLGKASLYSAFGNKQSMYLKALAHYESVVVDAAVHALTNREHKVEDRISAFLNSPIAAVQANNDRRGCFLCNASADRASLDVETAELVQRGYAKLHEALLKALSEESPSDNDQKTAQARASLVLSVYSGLRVMARSGVSIEMLADARDACLETLQLRDLLR